MNCRSCGSDASNHCQATEREYPKSLGTAKMSSGRPPMATAAFFLYLATVQAIAQSV